jgi:lactoylglutathione lyase
MKFGYTIIYVTDVPSSLAFFERAFGFERKFVDETGDYGELDTGATTLSFAAHTLGASNLPDGYVPADGSVKPLGMEIALVTDAVEIAHQQAIAAGAIELKAPMPKPWGQVVSYLRCPDGTLVELCTPIA